MTSPRAHKDNHQNHKCWDKNTIKDLEQVFLKPAYDLPSWLLSSKTSLLRIILSSWSVICLALSVFQKRILKKQIESFWKIETQGYWKYISQYKFYNFKKFQYLVTKQICHALCTLKYGLLSKWVTQSKTTFLINEFLNYGTAMIFQIFQHRTQKTAKNLSLLCCFCKILTLYITGNKGKLTVIQTSFVLHNSLQFSCTPSCLFWGFVLNRRAKWKSMINLINKNS